MQRVIGSARRATASRRRKPAPRAAVATRSAPATTCVNRASACRRTAWRPPAAQWPSLPMSEAAVAMATAPAGAPPSAGARAGRGGVRPDLTRADTRTGSRLRRWRAHRGCGIAGRDDHCHHDGLGTAWFPPRVRRTLPTVFKSIGVLKPDIPDFFGINGHVDYRVESWSSNDWAMTAGLTYGGLGYIGDLDMSVFTHRGRGHGRPSSRRAEDDSVRPARRRDCHRHEDGVRRHVQHRLLGRAAGRGRGLCSAT